VDRSGLIAAHHGALYRQTDLRISREFDSRDMRGIAAKGD
jgi:hypothetical protein